MASAGGRQGPSAWLLRLRTLGPGALRRRQYRAAGKTGHKERGAARPSSGNRIEPQARQRIAEALRAVLETYPIDLLAARVGQQELDLILRAPATDLPLVADLVKRRLMTSMREVGLRGRIWRKGFMRRALGTEGDLRRAIVLFRRDARAGRSALLDRARHDERLGIRRQRPTKHIE